MRQCFPLVGAVPGGEVGVCEEYEQLAFVQIGAQRRLAGAGLDAVRGNNRNPVRITVDIMLHNRQVMVKEE